MDVAETTHGGDEARDAQVSSQVDARKSANAGSKSKAATSEQSCRTTRRASSNSQVDQRVVDPPNQVASNSDQAPQSSEADRNNSVSVTTMKPDQPSDEQDKDCNQPSAANPREGIRLELGAELEARDEYGKWYKAKIINIDSNAQPSCLLVHFLGWPSRFDRWYTVDSTELRPTYVPFVVGSMVLARWHFKLYPARVVSVNRDGTYDVVFLEDNLRKTLRARSIQVLQNVDEATSADQLQELMAIKSDSASTVTPSRTDSETTIASAASAMSNRTDDLKPTSAAAAESAPSALQFKTADRNGRRHRSEQFLDAAPASTSTAVAESESTTTRPKRRCTAVAAKSSLELSTTSKETSSTPTQPVAESKKRSRESPHRASDRLKNRNIVPAATILELMKKSAPSANAPLTLRSAATGGTTAAAATAKRWSLQFEVPPAASLTASDSPLNVEVNEANASAATGEMPTVRSAPISMKKESEQPASASVSPSDSAPSKLSEADLVTTSSEKRMTVVAAMRSTRPKGTKQSVLPAPPISKHSREGRIMPDSQPADVGSSRKSTSTEQSEGNNPNEASERAEFYDGPVSDSDSDDKPLALCLAAPSTRGRSLPNQGLPTLPSDATFDPSQQDSTAQLAAAPLAKKAPRKRCRRGSLDVRRRSGSVRRRSSKTPAAVEGSAGLNSETASVLVESVVAESQASASASASLTTGTVESATAPVVKKRVRRKQIVDPRAIGCPQGCRRKFLKLEDFDSHLKYGHHLQYDEVTAIIMKHRDLFEKLDAELRQKPLVDLPTQEKPAAPAPAPVATAQVATSSEPPAEIELQSVAEDKEDEKLAKRRRRASRENIVPRKRRRSEPEKRKRSRSKVQRQGEADNLAANCGGGAELEAAEDAAVGGQKKLANDDVVACICAQAKERGLMIQCDLCYSWQHSECYYGRSVTEETIPAMHCCVACLYPYSVRDSQRFLHEYITFLRDARLPKLAPLVQLQHANDASAGADAGHAKLKKVTEQIAELDHVERLLEFERCRIAQLRQARAGTLRLFGTASKSQTTAEDDSTTVPLLEQVGTSQPKQQDQLGSPPAKRICLGDGHVNATDTNAAQQEAEAEERSVIESLKVIGKLVDNRLQVLHEVTLETERFLQTDFDCVPITTGPEGRVALAFGLDEKSDNETAVEPVGEHPLASGSSTSNSLRSPADLLADSTRSPPLSVAAARASVPVLVAAKQESGVALITDRRLAKLAQRLRKELGKLKRV